jgi:hypothetical protein
MAGLVTQPAFWIAIAQPSFGPALTPMFFRLRAGLNTDILRLFKDLQTKSIELVAYVSRCIAQRRLR